MSLLLSHVLFPVQVLKENSLEHNSTILLLWLHWGQVPTRVQLFWSLQRLGLRVAPGQQCAESWGVIAHPPSFKGLIRAFRRVGEKRGKRRVCSGSEESETSGFRLKPKLGYELPAKAYLYRIC
jgi:hypothetical protein